MQRLLSWMVLAILMVLAGVSCTHVDNLCFGQWGNLVPCPEPPNSPGISIFAPPPDSIVTKEPVTVSGSVSSNATSKAPIVALYYQLDGGSEVDVASQRNGFSFTLYGLPKGVHDISVAARDSDGQSASSYVSIYHAPGRSGKFFLLSFQDMTGGRNPPCMDYSVFTTVFVHIYFWRTGGFSDPIDLIVEGLPQGVTGVFPKDHLNRTHELRWTYLTLEIADPSKVSPGSHPFRVRGVSGDMQDILTVPLVIQEWCK